ncbi:MAG: hypothetical protein QHD01_02830 [Bradyrhizobium sp.]|uniref:hypothetical protein n=1 Tax=Bradyrhizobium sp. TaxID=376 RepID=UPI0029B5B4DB|nr:hypothetical protein [Bradyrhizobium sp.]MDX3965519.1 hypothetical protein [Bradyrhizobium sp.]
MGRTAKRTKTTKVAAKKSVRKTTKKTAKPQAVASTFEARNLVLDSLASDTNRVIFDHIIGTHWPDDRKLDPPFDRLALAGLAANIKAHGIPVQTAQVQSCDDVKCVLDLMRAANPGGG